jgi:hypothetical protein
MNADCSLELLANSGLRRRREGSVAEPTATLAGQPAEWIPTAVGRLEAIAQLEDGWDGRRAPRISRSNIEIALQLLRGVMRKGTPMPEFVPTVRGGLQIEWHVPDIDLELEILSPARYMLSFEDRAEGRELEQELNADLSALVRAVARLTSRL